MRAHTHTHPHAHTYEPSRTHIRKAQAARLNATNRARKRTLKHTLILTPIPLPPSLVSPPASSPPTSLPRTQLQAQAIAVRQNAVMEAAHEAALDYPGATLSEPRQETYL